MMLPRYLLLLLLLKFTTARPPPTYGFFDRVDRSNNAAGGTGTGTGTGTAASSSTVGTTDASTDEVEGCTGFGCREEASGSISSSRHISQDNDREDDNDSEAETSGFKTIGSCTPVSLVLTTDSHPQDVSFELVCNEAAVWTYPSALIPQEGPHGMVKVNACVFLEHACCHFALHDSHGDDGGGSDDGDYSYMELKVNDEPVLKYNSLDDPSFTTLAKSFGNTCSATPSVNITPKDQPQDVNCKMGLERPLNFRITLDEHPEDLSWFLVCNDDDDNDDIDSSDDNQMVTVWDTPRGSLAGHVGQVAVEKACVPYDTTCAFTIIDSQGDGLSKGSGYTLTLGVSLLDAYVSEPFEEKSYCIGKKCGDKKTHFATENHSTDAAQQEEEKVDEFEKELDKLEEEEQQEELMIEEMKESSETRQEHIEVLQEELKQEEALEVLKQEQEEYDPPPQEPQQPQQDEVKDKTDCPKNKPPATPPTEDDQAVTMNHDDIDIENSSDSTASSNNEEADLLLKEELISLEEEEESFMSWILAGFGMVAFLLGLVVGAAYYMNSNRQSAAARVALSPMKNRAMAMLESDDDESTEPDDGTFVLDA